jgi:hypothetical protein
MQAQAIFMAARNLALFCGGWDQSEIPRCARNDRPDEFFRSLEIPVGAGRAIAPGDGQMYIAARPGKVLSEVL